MKKYIGTKEVEAEPMTMGEAYDKGLLQAGRVPNESEKSKAGYTLPAIGRVTDLHRLENVHAGRT